MVIMDRVPAVKVTKEQVGRALEAAAVCMEQIIQLYRAVAVVAVAPSSLVPMDTTGPQVAVAKE
jgi:hypothetical protein